MQEKPIELRSYFILLALSLVWGSSFILIKKALIAFDPIDLACMRIAISWNTGFHVFHCSDQYQQHRFWIIK